MSYSPVHTNFVGYRGLVLLNNTLLLASSGDVTFATNPIKSTANWGAGSWNAADTVAWSADMPEISASIDCDVTEGNAIAKIEEFSKRYKVNDSNGATPIVIRPSNSWGFDGAGYCERLEFKGQEKQNLTASIEAKAFFTDAQSVRDFGSESTSMDDKTGDTGVGGVSDIAYNALFPYWGQHLYMRRPSQTGEDTLSIPRSAADPSEQITGITDWGVSLTHNIQFKKTCGMDDSVPAAAGGWPLAPDYVALGAMTGDCSLTFVGSLNEYDFNYFYHTRAFAVAFNSPVEDGAPNNDHIGIIPAMTCESYPLSMQTGNDIITANFTYNAVGNGTDAPVMLSAWNKQYPGIGSIPTPQ